MFSLIKKLVRAPLSYLADLRKITFSNYLLLHTNFSPSYPIMILTALASTLVLAVYIIYFIFNISDNNACIREARIGTIIISILYPIETILFFISLTGSIALSKNNCWKVFWMLVFGPVLCGFGFGELGFIEMCLLGTENERTFNAISFMKNPSFIEAMVYLYICFLILYFILVPSFEFLYSRQKGDQDEERQRKNSQSKRSSSRASEPKGEEVVALNSQKTCCSRFICVFYYFLNILFCIVVIFMLLIKILGPILFAYIWIQMGRNSDNYAESKEKTLFGLSLFSFFGPIAITVIVLGIQRIVKLGRKKDSFDDIDLDSKDKNTIDLSEGDRNSDFSDKIKKSNASALGQEKLGEEMEGPKEERRNSMVEDRSVARQTLL